MNQLLDIFLFFLDHPQGDFCGSQVAMTLGMPQTTAYHKLNLLAKKGLIDKINKNYKLSPELTLKLKSALRAISYKTQGE